MIAAYQNRATTKNEAGEIGRGLQRFEALQASVADADGKRRNRTLMVNYDGGEHAQQRHPCAHIQKSIQRESSGYDRYQDNGTQEHDG